MMVNKIKPKISKVISKFPTKVTVLRSNTNEFGEPTVSQVVCEITGFRHDGSSNVSKIIKESGEIKREKQNFLMVVYDQVSVLIEEGDFFEYKGIKYEIIDKGNCNNMDIYFDMLLKRC